MWLARRALNMLRRLSKCALERRAGCAGLRRSGRCFSPTGIEGNRECGLHVGCRSVKGFAL